MFFFEVDFFAFSEKSLYESVQKHQDRREKIVSGEFFLISEDRAGGKKGPPGL